MSAHCSAGAVADAAAAAGALLGLGVARAFQLVASLTDAPLPCQMQLYFVARLVCRSATVSSLCTIEQTKRETETEQNRDREKKRG